MYIWYCWIGFNTKTKAFMMKILDSEAEIKPKQKDEGSDFLKHPVAPGTN